MIKNGKDHPLNTALEAIKGMMVPALTPEALDTIEARANAATKGPWVAANNGRIEDAEWHYPVSDPASVDFIIHARDDIPALVVELRRLRTENEEQRRKINSAPHSLGCQSKNHPWICSCWKSRAALTGEATE